MNKIPVFVDCDTGIDDAIALTILAASNNICILGVSTVGGNVSLENTTRNTCNVLNLLSRSDIKVATGAEKPLERPLMKASGVHGVKGLRGWTFETDFTDNLIDKKAWDYMAEKIFSSKEKVTIVALAPVTNIAIMLEKYPNVKNNIEAIVFMGTSWHDGNPTPITTFNVQVDPEAFDILLKSGVKIVVAPLDTLRNGAKIHNDEVEEIGKMNTKLSSFIYSLLKSYGVANIEKNEVIDTENEETITQSRIDRAKNEEPALLDPACAAIVIDSSLFTFNHYYCQVELKGELTTGFTLIDKKNFYGKSEDEKNLWFAETMDRDGFARLFLSLIRNYGGKI